MPWLGRQFGIRYDKRAGLDDEQLAPLRRTCAAVLTNAGGIYAGASAYRSAKRAGHSVTIAEKHYVDYAGKLGTEEIARLLEERAKRKETSYEEYEFRYLPALRASADELVRRGTCRSVSNAYAYQAHHNVQFDLSVPTD